MTEQTTFAFLLLKEHPFGREMLRQILSEGFTPTIIISEETRQLLTIPVVLTQIGSVDIRGRSRPVTIYALSEGDQADQQVGSGGGLRDSGPAS